MHKNGAKIVINPADTAWMLTATALVLLMTLPALALFYGGLVQAKNILSVLVQCAAVAAITFEASPADIIASSRIFAM